MHLFYTEAFRPLQSRHSSGMTTHTSLTLTRPSRSHVFTRLHRVIGKHVHDDTGSATAEYAIATMAAVGFAGLLVVILRGDEVKALLTDMIRRALLPGG
jgi:hypothetical protein